VAGATESPVSHTHSTHHSHGGDRPHHGTSQPAARPDEAASARPQRPAGPKQANTATQPSRGTSATRRTFRITDDFSGDRRDNRIWEQVVTGTDVDIDQRNGWLVVDIGPGAVAGGPYNVIDGHFGTQCKLVRDFDARVDFVLLDWPAANGVWVSLDAYAVGEVGRTDDVGGEYYSGSVGPDVGSVLPLGDLSGSLRMTRVNGRVTNYFRRGDSWVKLNSGTAHGWAVTIALSVWSTNGNFGHKHVRAAFDNFVVTAPEFGCPPGQPFPGTSS
jgi:hypothetical protein